jgi:hypothetical protein
MSSRFIERRNEEYCAVNGKAFCENLGDYLGLVLHKWRFVCSYVYYFSKISLSKTYEYGGFLTY